MAGTAPVSGSVQPFPAASPPGDYLTVTFTRRTDVSDLTYTPEFSAASKVLAANQGLYNGFLAAGLFWGLWLGVEGLGVKLFFLSCVVVAGVFGAVTASPRIFFVQALPALVALALLLV